MQPPSDERLLPGDRRQPAEAPGPRNGAGLGQGIERLLKPNEVAKLLGVSRSWLYDAAKDGRIPSLRLGGVDGPLRFVEADLCDWLERARAEWRPGDTSRDTLRRPANRQVA